MVRRFLYVTTFVACAAAYVVAAERATFVLTDGERKSGSVVFHGDSHENLINGFLNLGNDAGGEQTFPVDQVAVIDFSGSRPAANEQSALSNDSQLLVLRNGQLQAGRFINLIGGDTLLWQPQSGDRQQYAIRDVSRVYLNAATAQTAYFRGRTRDAAAAAPASAIISPGVVRVQANQTWVDTGMTVKRGQALLFNATGTVTIAPNASGGPDGVAGLTDPKYPVPGNMGGTLIAKVGNSAPFAIGSISKPIGMPAPGKLMLAVNDDILNDNSGAFTVTITNPGR